MKDEKPPRSAPTNLLEWKAKTSSPAPGGEDAEAMTDDEYEAISEQVVEADEFFCDRLDEVFHLACRKFPLADTASLMQSAYQHMVNIMLDYYRIGPPEDRDECLPADLVAAVALRRFEDARLIVRCRHGKPYKDCKPCVTVAEKTDASFLAEVYAAEEEEE